MAKIADYLSESEILAQLAEEAAELAQAALKLRRAIDGTNPTPKNREECVESLVEEYADVAVCANALEDSYFNFVPYYYDKKKERWLKRLQKNKAAKTDKVDAVEVVRCKDCVNARPLNMEDSEESCYIDGCVWCIERQTGMMPDEYCSDGERKVGDE